MFGRFTFSDIDTIGGGFGGLKGPSRGTNNQVRDYAAVIGDTVGRAFASYTPVEASVVDEHTEQRIVADRRGNNTDVVRIVTVELPEGIRADVPSDDLAVGSDATVYLSGSGAVFASPPPPPGVLEWALCALVLTATIVLGVVTVRAAGRLRRAPE